MSFLVCSVISSQKTVQTGGGGNSTRRGYKKHRRSLNYCVIGKFLAKHVNKGNDRNRRPDGPFGTVARELQWTNNESTRKYLQLIWKRNKSKFLPYTVPTDKSSDDSPNSHSKSPTLENTDMEQNELKCSLSASTESMTMPEAEPEKSVEEIVYSDSVFNKNYKRQSPDPITASKSEIDLVVPVKPLHGYSQLKPTNKRVTKNFRQVTQEKALSDVLQRKEANESIVKRVRKVKRFSDNWMTDHGRKYCICNKFWKNVDGGFMVECEKCNNWYHLTCLNIPIKLIKQDSKIAFICGQKTCNNGQRLFNVNNENTSVGECEIDIDKKEDECEIVNREDREDESETVNREDREDESETVNREDREDQSETVNRQDREDQSETVNREDQSETVNREDECEILNKDDECEIVNKESECEIVDDDDECEIVNKGKFDYVYTENMPISSCDTAATESPTFTVKNTDMTGLNNKNERISHFAASLGDISEILNINVEKEIFNFQLPECASFCIPSETWCQLKKTQRGRHFARGAWQHIFVNRIKESNPYCSFVFKYHKVNKEYNKANSALFTARAACQFSDCPVSVSIRMRQVCLVDVHYSGNVKHNIKEMRSRPIRNAERENLKTEFVAGIKPLKKYIESVQKVANDVLVSGNCDGFGKDSQVYAQIASESRQNRLDKDCLQSLILQMDSMKKETNFGFIQKICAKPTYILYWSYEGLQLFHKFASNLCLFWDATGSIVRKSDTKKQFLYYELTLENPLKGKMGIPIAAMMSEDQSLPTILDWMTSFRHSEKQKFGHSNLCRPKSIISDKSWVFILAALKVFNSETLQQFLSRAWTEIMAGSINAHYTIVHLCSSHIMNNFKKFVLKQAKTRVHTNLYMLSLLMNCRTIAEAEEILFDVCVALLVPQLDDNVKFFVNRLFRRINTFQIDVADSKNTATNYAEIDADELSGRYTEEEFLNLASASPFKLWGSNIAQSAKALISDSHTEKNSYYCDALAKEILTKYVPILPLWSALMMPELSSINEENARMCRTTSTIENRFRILKHICLGGRKQMRLDDFSHELCKDTVSIQRICTRNAIKVSKRNPHPKRKLQTVHEEWNKLSEEPTQLQNRTGKYQQPPLKPIKMLNSDVSSNVGKADKEYVLPDLTQSDRNVDLIQNTCTSSVQDFEEVVIDSANSQQSGAKNKSLFKRADYPGSSTMPGGNISSASKQILPINIMHCPMQNIGATTCWFNSFIQGLSVSHMTQFVVRKYCSDKIPKIDVEPSVESYCKISHFAIADILRFIVLNRVNGTAVPKTFIETALSCISLSTLDNTLPKGKQNDIDEFNRCIIASLAEEIDEKLTILQTLICTNTNCSNKSEKSEIYIQTLYVEPPQERKLTTISDLIRTYFKPDSLELSCHVCKNQKAMKHLSITKLPKTLLIGIKRYNFNQTTLHTKKNSFEIIPDSVLYLDEYFQSPAFSAQFSLKSIICHFGQNCCSGHYVTFVPDAERDVFIKVDDEKCSLYQASDSEILENSYIIIYDQIVQEPPQYLNAIVKCLSNTCGMQYAVDVSKNLLRDKTFLKQLDYLAGSNANEALHDLKRYILMANIQVPDNPRKNSVSNGIDTIFSCFFDQYQGNSQLLVDSFHTVIDIVHTCVCGSVKVITQSLSFLECNSYKFDDIDQCLNLNKTTMSCEKCAQKMTRKAYVTGVPHTLIIYFCGNIQLMTQAIINLRMKNLFPPNDMECRWEEYTLHRAIVLSENAVDYVECKDNTLITEDNVPYTAHAKNGSILLFMNRGKIKVSSIIKIRKLSAESSSAMYIDQVSISATRDERNSIQFLRGNKKETPIAIPLYIINRESLLRSTDINLYMELLCENAPCKVHAFDASWFGNVLLYGSNPDLFRGDTISTSSKAQYCMENDFVIVPVNIRDVHWIVLVIDIRKQVVYHYDPLGNKNDIIITRLWLFLNKEHLKNKGKLLNMNDWSFIDYCSRGFPAQTDATSCGAFICIVAKALILNKFISYSLQKDLGEMMRKNVAYDLVHGCLIVHTQSAT